MTILVCGLMAVLRKIALLMSLSLARGEYLPALSWALQGYSLWCCTG